MDFYIHCTSIRCLFMLLFLFVFEFYFNLSVYLNFPHITRNYRNDKKLTYYKYPLINSMEVAMGPNPEKSIEMKLKANLKDYEYGYNSSYHWFMAMRYLFKIIGEEANMRYPKATPMCNSSQTSLGPIQVDKNETNLKWIEKQIPDVKLGGYYAPAHCRSAHRVAVIVPYRDRRANLGVFLRYIHPLLRKQLLEYRIFVIEQYGTEKFNKGTLYNIAYLETQRFGIWSCLIFHDVGLIPEDERISYSCPENPTHMSTAIESFGYAVPYRLMFSGVTALTPEQYRTANGYSNLYWDWGAEDEDFYGRLQLRNYNVSRYNSSIARYASLPHWTNDLKNERILLLLMISKLRSLKEGLTTTKYKLVEVTQEKLYTHILADVNPTGMSLNTKSLMQKIIKMHRKSIIYGHDELKASA